MSTTISIVAIDGPSTDRVIDALKYAFSKSGDMITVEFRVMTTESRLQGSNDWQKVSAQIIGVHYESGAPGMFELEMNITGYSEAGGFYNANKREGQFSFVAS